MPEEKCHESSNGSYDATSEETIEQSALSLLESVWLSIDFEKWNIRELWGIFERRVKSCAFQNLYPKPFFQQLCAKMRVPSASKYDLIEVLKGNDRKIVDFIRANTALCVMRLRVKRNEIQKLHKEMTNNQ